MKRTDAAFVLHDNSAITPFVSPYGPSVLQCGQQGCGVTFYKQQDLRRKDMHLIVREERAKHLSEVFKINDAFTS